MSWQGSALTAAAGTQGDPAALAQTFANQQALNDAAAQKFAAAGIGALAPPPGTYTAHADGSITFNADTDIPGPWSGKNGFTITADGTQVKPDGSVLVNTDGQPVLSPITASGDKTTAWTHDNGPTKVVDAATNVITKDNPVAGTVRAGVDIGQGKGLKQAGSDFAAGTSFGTLPQLDANGHIVPGDTTKAGADALGLPAGIPLVTGGLSLPSLGLGGGIGGGDRTIDPKAQSEVDRANNLADVLDVDRQKAGTQADTDRGLGVQTREQQQQSIAGLQAAANGTVPSAAELALTRQSGIDAARQYGLAAALQGSNPAAALRQASIGSARVAGDTAANAVQLRAKEQADARTALANTLAGVRNSDQGAVNTDVTQQSSAQTGETTSQGQGVTAEGNILQRQSAKDQADATKTGAEIGALGALTGGLLTKSDRRAKKDIAKVGLADALGREVKGVEFTYVPGEEDGGRHVGVLADELESVMPGVVSRGRDGMKQVHTGHLSLGNTGAIAELARRLRALEKSQ